MAKNKVYLLFVLGLSIMLFSCPGVYKVPDYIIKLGIKENILTPDDNATFYVMYRGSDYNENWHNEVNYPYNMLYSSSSEIRCKYSESWKTSPKMIQEISNQEAVFKVPTNISGCLEYGKNHIYVKNVDFSSIKINYPAKAELSVTTARIGDEITITSTKPFFDTETFSQEKMKLLEEIDYRPIWVKGHGNIQYYIGLPISDCTVESPTKITFKVPENAVSGQVLVLNEGGFECALFSEYCDAEAIKTKYINFNNTTCEKYAYYATKTELLITDTDGNRVD